MQIIYAGSVQPCEAVWRFSLQPNATADVASVV